MEQSAAQLSKDAVHKAKEDAQKALQGTSRQGPAAQLRAAAQRASSGTAQQAPVAEAAASARMTQPPQSTAQQTSEGIAQQAPLQPAVANAGKHAALHNCLQSSPFFNA